MSCEMMLLAEPKKKVKSNEGAGNTNLVSCSCGLCWGHALGHGLWSPATNAKESKLASPHGGAFKNERKMSCCTFILLLNLEDLVLACCTCASQHTHCASTSTTSYFCTEERCTFCVSLTPCLLNQGYQTVSAMWAQSAFWVAVMWLIHELP